MNQRWIYPLLACAAWLPATVALATGEPPKVQMKPAPEGGEATAPGTTVAPVTVEALKPEEVKKQTFNFVQTFATPTPKLEQIARWEESICVTVQGLPADQGAKMKARVEEVAKALGVDVAGRGCNPNIEIKVSAQPQVFLDLVARTHEDMLGYDHARERDKLKMVTRPIQAWYRTASIGQGNTAVSTFATVASGTVGSPQEGTLAPTGSSNTGGRQASGKIIDDPDERGATGCADNRFTSCVKSAFDHILVMVDANAVQGADSGLIADYVTVLSLSQPKSLDACNGLQSVIDIYARACAGRDPPNGLTRADVAYLTALYKTNPEARKASQQGDIAGRMADMLIKADKTDRLVREGGTVKASTGR